MHRSRASPGRRRCRCGRLSAGSADIGGLALTGLIRAGRADHGKRRRVADDLRRLAEGLALATTAAWPQRHLSGSLPHRAARGEQPPGYHTIYNVIRAIPDDLKTLALDGEKAYREAYDLVHRREAERPNQIWQADHTQLDLWAKRDDGQAERPWLTVIIDDYSRAIAGFSFSFDSPSAVRTALALRQAIWRKADAHWIVFGIPEMLYTDNGSDFTSIHLEQVAADIKMRLIFSDAWAAAWARAHRALLRDRQPDVPLHAARLHRGRRCSRRARIDPHGPRSRLRRIPARVPRAAARRNQGCRPRSAGSRADLSRAWQNPWSISICCF